MQKSFSLRVLIVAITLIAGGLGSIISFRLQGLLVFLSVVLALLILVAPSQTSFSTRLFILFTGVGAAMAAWCVLRGQYGMQEIGRDWYRGRLDEIGGWSMGIFVAAWRASALFAKARIDNDAA